MDFKPADIDDCEGVDCTNGACVDEVNDYHCECDLGYSGDFCDIGMYQKNLLKNVM